MASDAALLALADRLSSFLHRGQWYDEAHRVSYIDHPRAVARLLNDPYDKVVALLHDTLEDTWISQELLMLLFPEEVVAAVVALTRDPHQPAAQDQPAAQRRYYRQVVDGGPRAIRVKLADIESNHLGGNAGYSWLTTLNERKGSTSRTPWG